MSYPLEPYNSSWPIIYSQECYSLKSKLGDSILDIEHIGSTAIPEMRAKPIIDIMASVKSFDNIEPLILILESIGYHHKPELSSPERFFFRKGSPVKFHLSITQPGRTSYWNRQILFRNYLRDHPDEVKCYEHIKMEAVKNLSEADLDDLSLNKKYNDAKSAYISRILKEAEKINEIKTY